MSEIKQLWDRQLSSDVYIAFMKGEEIIHEQIEQEKEDNSQEARETLCQSEVID